MNAGEREVALTQVQEGAMLSRALLDTSGMVLLAQGAVLTAGSLAALHRRGVEACWIVASPLDDAGDQERASAARQEQLARLAILFRGTPPGAPGADLLALLQRYRQRSGA